MAHVVPEEPRFSVHPASQPQLQPLTLSTMPFSQAAAFQHSVQKFYKYLIPINGLGT